MGIVLDNLAAGYVLVSLYSRIRPNILRCVCMSSAVLLVYKLSLLLYSAGLGVSTSRFV